MREDSAVERAEQERARGGEGEVGGCGRLSRPEGRGAGERGRQTVWGQQGTVVKLSPSQLEGPSEVMQPRGNRALEVTDLLMATQRQVAEPAFELLSCAIRCFSVPCSSEFLSSAPRTWGTWEMHCCPHPCSPNSSLFTPLRGRRGLGCCSVPSREGAGRCAGQPDTG